MLTYDEVSGGQCTTGMGAVMKMLCACGVLLTWDEVRKMESTRRRAQVVNAITRNVRK